MYEISQSSGDTDQSIFLQKSWTSILDNNNNSYSSGQVTIDTSQLSNSNRWMNYREAYLSVPLLLTASCSNDPLWSNAFTSADYAFGLKITMPVLFTVCLSIYRVQQLFTLLPLFLS